MAVGYTVKQSDEIEPELAAGEHVAQQIKTDSVEQFADPFGAERPTISSDRR